ncbi:MAG: tetratricopeptide repeat protein [Armatimonadetes bacterium]|nr:tetratricopeptide repeat protein [Armatimonadota bacterium]
MIHPLAEQARQALRSHRFSAARQMLSDAVARGEKNPDVLCEHLICESYFGNEEDAARRFNEAKNALRTNDLQLLLSRYFHCRQLLSRKLERADIHADDWLKAHPYTPEPGVGIRISACLIAKNEEKVLAKCLDSLKSIVDEIVVVDTGSTDRTVDIAQSYGAIIGEFPWINDFSAARNHALSLATGEWALWIDADEQLDATCATEFPKGIVRPHLGGYSIEIVNYLDDSGTTTEFVHNPTRLFRRIEGVHFTEPIHEQITPSLMALGLAWTPLPGCFIHHDGYRQAALEEKNKVARTLGILEGVIEKNPNDPFQLFNLANTYFVATDYEKAVDIARRGIQHMPAAGAEYGHAVYQVLITSLEILGRREEALAACDACDRTAYNGIINEYLRASVLLNLGRIDESMKACEKCLSLSWPDGCIGDKGIADFRRYALHAQLLGCKGQWQKALDEFEVTLAKQPGFLPAIMGRAQAFEKLGRFDEAEQDYQTAIQDARQVSLCAQGLGHIAEHKGDLRSASEWYEKAWRAQPENAALWTEWTDTIEKVGDRVTIEHAFSQFLEFNEPSSAFYTNWARALEKFEDYGEALTKYQAAINLDPADANAGFNCGDLLYRLGAYPQAAQVYEMALRSRMDYADGWFVLGNCMAQMNHDQAAVKCYSQALVLDPHHTKAQANLQTVTAA